MKTVTVRKDLQSEIKKGDLVRIRGTGEVFVYCSAEYSVNWHWSITDDRGNYWGQHNLFNLQVVDKSGSTLKEWIKDD